MVLRYRVIVGCKADLQCFLVAKRAVWRPFEKAALNDRTDDELAVETLEAAAMVTSLVLEVTTADLLWSTLERLPLYYRMAGGVLSFL